MANFTMEIRELMENPLINGVFTFDYDFYGNEEEKKQFEKLFIQYYYFHEIGFETPERFKHQLKAKLDLIAPYYRQLYLTEWNRVKTIDEMMTSKNLKETTEHKQSITGENETESQGSSSSHQSDSMNQSSTSSGTNDTTSSGTSSSTSSGTSSTKSSGTNTTSSTTKEKPSSLSDGVAQASLSDGYLTAIGESNNTSNVGTSDTSNAETNSTASNTLSSTDITKSSSNETSNSTSNTQGTSEQSGKTLGSNKQELSESTIFTSRGDVGIQTPAYAIAEWRKVLININQLMIDECKDLFMKIY